jgi:hypothetical protein
MIKGGCPFAPSGSRPQLASALDYLRRNAGQVSPVTLDIGANDVLHDTNTAACSVNVTMFNADLATLDSNLTRTILPALSSALTVKGHMTGDLLIMNYYDPLQNLCPKLIPYTLTVNKHIASDVKGFGMLVDVFKAFGGASTPNPNICTYTWICSSYHDIHATNKGYLVIAGAFERQVDY